MSAYGDVVVLSSRAMEKDTTQKIGKRRSRLSGSHSCPVDMSRVPAGEKNVAGACFLCMHRNDACCSEWLLEKGMRTPCSWWHRVPSGHALYV